MTGSRVLRRSPTLLVATVTAIIAATYWYGLPQAAAQAQPRDNTGRRSGGETGRPIREDIVLRESIDVRLISLDAVVTDSSDRPVTGLTRDDFELKVEGEPVEILSVSVAEDLRETVTGRLTILLFIDERHLQRKHRDTALAEIADALDAEIETNPTWVAAAAFGERLEPLLAPTRDREAVRTVITAASSREPPASRRTSAATAKPCNSTPSRPSPLCAPWSRLWPSCRGARRSCS